jgi:hypothetical protein
MCRRERDLIPTISPIFRSFFFAGEPEKRLVFFQRRRLARLLRVTGLGQEFDHAPRFAALCDIPVPAPRPIV